MADVLPRIALVVPCYNEQQALPVTVPRMLGILDQMADKGMVSPDSFILCCNDGSNDDTWRVIERLHLGDSRVKGISLAHNRGHQYALLAGLMTVRDMCDAAISLDADLQDDPNAIEQMVDAFKHGKEIVYGVRSSRQTDSWFKRTSAHIFYRMQRAMGVDIIFDHADYRLMSARALDLLSEYGESNLFLRGIVPGIGLEHGIVRYNRDERIAGRSKYSLGNMLRLSIDGITSFSAKPMRLILVVGLLLLCLDILVAIWVLISHFFYETISGWSSLMLSVWFLGSLILIGMGIMGEYISKIFIEVKRRPRYAISDRLMD